MASIKSFIASLSNVRDARFLRTLFDAARAELVACRAAANELRTDHATNKSHMDALKTALNSVIGALTADGIINATALGVGTTPEQVASTAFQYRIDGVPYHKAAVAAGTPFSAADTINTGAAAGFFWGIWAVQIDAAGTVSTKSPAANQVYTSEALAIAALPVADAGKVVIGYVTVKTKANVDWVAITDDLTDASDCTEANFYNTASSIPAVVATSAAATLTAATAETLEA